MCAESSPQLPGLKPEFEAFIAEVRERGNYPVVITTQEGERRFSYWGFLFKGRQDSAPGSDIVTLTTFKDAASVPTVLLQIHRRVVTAWDYDQDGRKHASYLARGYLDGGMTQRPVST